MIYTDYENIKKVTFKVPDMMTDKAEEEVINLFNSIKALKDEISELRMTATKKDKELKVLQDKWNLLLPLLDIEFETKEKEEIHQDIYVGFNFGTDVNKHLH